MNCHAHNHRNRRQQLSRPSLTPAHGANWPLNIRTTCIGPFFLSLGQGDFDDMNELAAFLARWESKAAIESGRTDYVEAVQWRAGVMCIIAVGEPAWIDRALFDPMEGLYAGEWFSGAHLTSATTADKRCVCCVFGLTLSDCARKVVRLELERVANGGKAVLA